MATENRKLKRHVNKLIRMNDYLKNQLVRGDLYENKVKKDDNPPSEIKRLKIEI